MKSFHLLVHLHVENRIAELESDDFVAALEVIDVHGAGLLLRDDYDQGRGEHSLHDYCIAEVYKEYINQ